VQGSASDVIKLAMLLFRDRMRTYHFTNSKPSGVDPSMFSDCRLLMQIHDELIFEVPCPLETMMSDEKQRKAIDDFIGSLRGCLEQEVVSRLSLEVPLVCNIKVGRTWGDMIPWISPCVEGIE
jgi:DNA polymerase I-like protein with 3'-5' exonuclease and polymerase domains